MTHHSHLLTQKHNSISYKAAFPYAMLGVIIIALLFVYIVTSVSITSAVFSLGQLRAKKQEIVMSYNELVHEQNVRTSLEYISGATASLGLEEINYADYLKLQESGIVVQR